MGRFPRKGVGMPLVHECAAPDCHVVTMGAFCIDHERETVPPADVLLDPSATLQHRAEQEACVLPGTGMPTE
jgi:hypothetical protein